MVHSRRLGSNDECSLPQCVSGLNWTQLALAVTAAGARNQQQSLGRGGRTSVHIIYIYILAEFHVV